MTRKRFKRSIVASSRGAFVAHSHTRYLKECHECFEPTLTITVKVPPKYFVRCFGKLIQITEREAMMHNKMNIIIK